MEKTSNKYIIFPIVMIIVSILNFLFPYVYSYAHKNSLEIVEIMDITGYTKIFSICFLIINIFVLLICLNEGRKGKENGYNYEFNKIFAITFIALSIINILAFVLIRNKEEAYAKELNNEVNIFTEDNIYYLESGNKNTKNKKQKNKLEQIMKIMETDRFYARKLQIYNEMKETPSKFKRYVNLLIYWNYYNEDNTSYLYYTIKPSDAECYYAIYSIAIITDLICSAFYIKNINDKKIKENTEILNN